MAARKYKKKSHAPKHFYLEDVRKTWSKLKIFITGKALHFNFYGFSFTMWLAKGEVDDVWIDSFRETINPFYLRNNGAKPQIVENKSDLVCCRGCSLTMSYKQYITNHIRLCLAWNRSQEVSEEVIATISSWEVDPKKGMYNEQNFLEDELGAPAIAEALDFRQLMFDPARVSERENGAAQTGFFIGF